MWKHVMEIIGKKSESFYQDMNCEEQIYAGNLADILNQYYI